MPLKYQDGLANPVLRSETFVKWWETNREALQNLPLDQAVLSAWLEASGNCYSCAEVELGHAARALVQQPSRSTEATTRCQNILENIKSIWRNRGVDGSCQPSTQTVPPFGPPPTLLILINRAYNIVEAWPAESPSQKEWKENWLWSAKMQLCPSDSEVAPLSKLELVDGVYTIVEIWEAVSAEQKEWKENWLANARRLGATHLA